MGWSKKITFKNKSHFKVSFYGIDPFVPVYELNLGLFFKTAVGTKAIGTNKEWKFIYFGFNFIFWRLSFEIKRKVKIKPSVIDHNEIEYFS